MALTGLTVILDSCFLGFFSELVVAVNEMVVEMT